MDNDTPDRAKLRQYADHSAQWRAEAAKDLAAGPAVNAILAQYAPFAGRIDEFKPFADETTSLQLEGLTIENHVDRVVAYDGEGIDVEITRDQEGLDLARREVNLLVKEVNASTEALSPRKAVLARLMNTLITFLDAEPDLPAKIENVPTTTVSNPFA